MVLRFRSSRDPWWDDGQGARRQHTRQRVIGTTAFVAAIVATGLTVAMWVRELAPLAERLLG